MLIYFQQVQIFLNICNIYRRTVLESFLNKVEGLKPLKSDTISGN